MNALEELLDYCTTPVSVGALMLTGGWGTGKTHFVENELRDALKDTHIFLRVSLFSHKSLDTLNEEIKRLWLFSDSALLNSLEKYDDDIQKGKEMLEKSISSTAGNVQPTLKGLRIAASLSSALMDLLPINHQVKTKNGLREAVLVFDDFERTRIDMLDVLGCINEYCENRQFKAIIIANEERIGCLNTEKNRDTAGNPLYYEFKEKTVSRTVRYKPDAGQVLHSILNDRSLFDEEYRQFLLKNESLISDVFCVPMLTGSNASIRFECDPVSGYNIRVLKSALQDFFRVYHFLEPRHVEEIERFLYCFLAYTIANKNGLIVRDENGQLQSDEAVHRVYPLFKDYYMPTPIKNWILYGEWEERSIGKEGWFLFQKEAQETPRERLRRRSLLEWEEADICSEYAGLLQDGYDGALSLDEYVTLIRNSCRIRQMGIIVPAELDWEKMSAGIQKRIDQNIQSDKDQLSRFMAIQPQHRDLYTPEELAAYDLIESYRKQNNKKDENAKSLFLRLIQEQGIQAFLLCGSIPAQGFDPDMARAAAACFDACSQSMKLRFPAYFEDYWDKCTRRNGADPAVTEAGLKTLTDELQSLKERYQKENLFIAARHADALMEKVQELGDARRNGTPQSAEQPAFRLHQRLESLRAMQFEKNERPQK